MNQTIKSLYKQFAGRCLLGREIKDRLSDWKDDSLQVALEELAQLRLVRKEPAVLHSSWAIRRKCNRCGAGASHIEVSECANCGSKACAYCTRCLFRGRAKSCTSLYVFLPSTECVLDYPVESTFPLLEAQQNTVTKLKTLVEEDVKHIKVVLISGCGEWMIIASFLEYLLSQKKRIFWCQEKREKDKTTNQLALVMPRLAKLMEDSTNEFMVLGTKWDLLTYNQQFDVIIWNGVEVESFHACERSFAQKAQQITITSTFPSWGVSPDIVHPVRLHRYALPVPTFIQHRGLRLQLQRKKAILPFRLFLDEIQSLNGQAMILVPTKEDVVGLMEWLKKRMPEIAEKTESISIDDENTEELRILFSEQKFMFLIMPQHLAERMRIANLHLCLLHADHPSLDRKRLVELSHFIGQSAYFPECEIWFIGEANTEIIVQTKKEHIYLNELAEKEGYLQKEV